MGRLSTENLRQEIEKGGYKLIDSSGYTNMNSDITIECNKGHQFITTLNSFRRPSFMCPHCDIKVDFKNPSGIPPKNGYRVIAFDQATEKFGLSVFDNGELVYYNLLVFSGTLINRLVKIKKTVEVIINNWQPDFIVMEDIQQQHGAVTTYKILAMLLGILEVLCSENDIQYEVVSPNVWRKFAGTCGKTRTEEKKLSVAVVKDKYNIAVTDDVAEAILIGRYGSMIHKPKTEWAF